MKNIKVIPDPLISDVVNSLKTGVFFPYKIKLSRCPSKKKRCTRRHGEVILTSYDEKTNEFHANYYAVHQRGIQFDTELKPSAVKNLFQQSRKKMLIKLPELKEIAKSLKFLTDVVSVRISEEERKILQRKAKQKKMDFSDYLRDKLLS